MAMDDLNEAIRLYVGWAITRYPQEEAARVAERFGAARGAVLTARVQLLLHELQAVPIDWQVHTLASGSAEAARAMKLRHPALDEAATSAMAWSFSWSFR